MLIRDIVEHENPIYTKLNSECSFRISKFFVTFSVMLRLSRDYKNVSNFQISINMNIIVAKT